MQFFHRLLQLLRKALINAVLHIQTVGADAGLSGVAELGRQRAFNRFIEAGIVKDDKRRITAQLQRDFFDVFGALFHQLTTNLRRTGERQFAHQRIVGQFVTDRARRTGDNTEYARRDPGAVCQFRQRQRGERRLAGGFKHHRAASRQCRTGFAGDHR